MKKYIEKTLASKVIMAGVTFQTDKPNGGGVSSVVATYDKYFDGLRYIPTWKQTNKIGKAVFFLVNYIRFFFLLCLDRRIRIVHIHAASDASFERKMMIFNLARLFRKKTILHMHAGEFDRYYKESSRKEQIRKTIMDCDKLIALSKSWREYFIAFGKKAEDVILLNNIVDFPEKSKTYQRDLRLLYLGWLGDKKGVFDLIDVIIANKEELKGRMKLKLGGFDNYDRIRSLIEDNALEELITLEGWVSGEKKTSILEWANVFILPSYYEGLPISILEAMSYGMPVISTPVGGIPDVVKDGVNGILVEPGNKEMILKAIRHYINQPDCIEKEGRESLVLVKPYTPESVLSHLRTIYTELL